MYVDNITYTCCTSAAKMSIIFLLRRIFVTSFFKHTTTVFIVILSGWWAAVLFAQIFSCTPVDAAWLPAKTQTCIDNVAFYNAVAISNVVFDVTLLILPMPMVWKLQITHKKKFQVCGVFLVGAL
jgi:hypothetical protein